MKYACEFDPAVILNEDEIYDHAASHLTYEEIADKIGEVVSQGEIIRELARFESPLFYTLYEAALFGCVEDFYHKIYDEDEEDEE